MPSREDQRYEWNETEAKSQDARKRCTDWSRLRLPDFSRVLYMRHSKMASAATVICERQPIKQTTVNIPRIAILLSKNIRCITLNKMFDTQIIHTEHKDVIHDVAYDYYGQRMATCSSDQCVKVWDQNEQGVWSVTSSWKSHSGSVWRLSWAHPEFGQVLATCSFDRTVSIWEETVGEKTNPAMPPQKRWVRRTNLVDSRTSVTDVKFAPKTQGLILAACSADGVIRIYEAPDIMNLSQWTLSHEISVKIPLSCLSWNPSMFRLHAPMIAAGSDDSSQSTGGKVFIFEYSENSRRWTKTETLNQIIEPVHDMAFAPNVGRSYHILAVASKDVQIFNLKPILDPTASSRLDVQPAAQFGDHYCTVWRVTWNITGTMLASTGDDGCVRMWKMNYLKNWRCTAVLKAENSESAPETSVTPSLKSSIVNATAKYYKRGTISHPGQVPRH